MKAFTKEQEETALRRSKSDTLIKIAEVANLVVETIEEAYPESGTITLASENWEQDNTADYPAYYDITLAGMSVTDRADIIFSGVNLNLAENAGVSNLTETGITEENAVYIRIRAVKIPEDNIVANYWITHKEEGE